jgi:hypothetical protein
MLLALHILLDPLTPGRERSGVRALLAAVTKETAAADCGRLSSCYSWEA